MFDFVSRYHMASDGQMESSSTAVDTGIVRLLTSQYL